MANKQNQGRLKNWASILQDEADLRQCILDSTKWPSTPLADRCVGRNHLCSNVPKQRWSMLIKALRAFSLVRTYSLPLHGSATILCQERMQCSGIVCSGSIIFVKHTLLLVWQELIRYIRLPPDETHVSCLSGDTSKKDLGTEIVAHFGVCSLRKDEKDASHELTLSNLCNLLCFRIVSIYQNLSGHIHAARLGASLGQVQIVEGHVARDQMHAIACICKALKVEYEMTLGYDPGTMAQ